MSFGENDKMLHTVLLSTAYLAPIQYYTKLLGYKESYIEQHEHFIKQSFRNRCVILDANGPIPLVIPIQKARKEKIKTKDVKIDNYRNWQKVHWRAMLSAYNNSPFFQYYYNSLEPFYIKKWNFLFDFNTKLQEVMIELLGITPVVRYTKNFEDVPITPSHNFREKITPKQDKVPKDPSFFPQKYTQVFNEKFGFIPNLSIIDLLFNTGPESHLNLKRSIQNHYKKVGEV
jgi:hypothetical protein